MNLNYNNNNINIVFYENSNILNITLSSKKYTKEVFSEYQIIINKYYEYASEKNIKYDIFLNINNLCYEDIKYLSIDDIIYFYNNNINKAEKYIKKMNILTNNYWHKLCINFFLYAYKIKLVIVL